MGVITYLFHRSDALTEQRYQTAFLDVGENIHIHYRDLRIELSVQEFEEFAAHFQEYLQGVRDAIRAGYRDGVLPNTNEPHTVQTFWNKTRLKWPVKYHRNDLSIEENTDGYHVHIRNYKLLLDRSSFRVLATAMAKALLLLDDRPPADPVDLLRVNDLHPDVKSRRTIGASEEIVLAIQDKYRKKVIQVLTGLGYKRARRGDGQETFVRDRSTILLASPEGVIVPEPAFIGRGSTLLPLTAFLEQGLEDLGQNPLNVLKLKLLYLFKLAEQGRHLPFRLEDVAVDSGTLVPVVDLFSRSESVPDPRKEYRRFSSLLDQKKRFFVKPTKNRFLDSYQDKLLERLHAHIAAEVSPHSCVNRVYLLGSGTQRRAGRYKVPFIHFDWAKLASDFDILIEIEPDHEGVIPDHWQHKFATHFNSCEYYHLGDIGNGRASEEARQYPGVAFFEHLIETYLFFPSRGDRQVKDKYLKDIKAKVIFERRGLIDWLEEGFGFRVDSISRMRAVSFNKVYDVQTDSGRFVLKVYDHRYISPADAGRVDYEMDLLASLRPAGLPVGLPVARQGGELVSIFGPDRAVLFEHMPGVFRHRPTAEDARRAGQLIGALHRATERLKLPEHHDVGVKRNLIFWLRAAGEYLADGKLAMQVNIDDFLEQVTVLDIDELHCHGDLSTRNFLFDDGACRLIDLQNAGWGSALVDVSDGMIEFAVQGDAFIAENAEAFLAGYDEVRSLSATARDNLWAICAAQAPAKASRLLRAHYGFGHALRVDLVEGMRKALEWATDRMRV